MSDPNPAPEPEIIDPAPNLNPDPAPPAPAPEPAPADPAPEPDKPDEFTWPDDWRERAVDGDEDLLKEAARYGSMKNIIKALRDAKNTIRAGKVQKPMPDASDEKGMAEWRKENNIPDDPSGYKLPDTISGRLTDDDKPILATFTDFAHKNSMPPAFVEKASEWYVGMMETVAEQQTAADKQAHEACEDSLRKEWAHGEYKANTKLAHSFLESIPGLATDFAVARMPNGRMLVQDPAFIAWAADMGREKFGDTAFTSADSERKHMARKDEIAKIRDTDFARYEAEGLDKEMRSIIEKEMKRK